MAGSIQDNLMFPILELVRGEISRNNNSQLSTVEDSFTGTPDVQLFRQHPDDPDRVTGALLSYPSGYIVDIYLNFGLSTEDMPVEIDADHPEWDYLSKWILSVVTSVILSPEREQVLRTQIRLNYDSNWRLLGTSVSTS
jgi:hypothetical protein